MYFTAFGENCLLLIYRTTHFKTSWADYVDTLIKSPALSLQIRRMATIPELPVKDSVCVRQTIQLDYACLVDLDAPLLQI